MPRPRGEPLKPKPNMEFTKSEADSGRIRYHTAWVNDVQAAVVEPVEADSGRIRYHTACCGWGAAWGDVRAADPLSATDSRGRLKDSRSTFDCRVL
jgi:hypothetical protein